MGGREPTRRSDVGIVGAWVEKRRTLRCGLTCTLRGMCEAKSKTQVWDDMRLVWAKVKTPDCDKLHWEGRCRAKLKTQACHDLRWEGRFGVKGRTHVCDDLL